VAALNELSVWHPSRESAEIAFVKNRAQAIAAGDVELDEVAREVTERIEIDTVIYDGLREPYLELVWMCWVVGTEEFEPSGGVSRLLDAVAEVLAAT